MNEITMRRIGNVLKAIQMDKLRRLTYPKNYIRTTFSHHVFAEGFGNFEQIVKYFLKSSQSITPEKFFRVMNHQEGLNARYLLMTFDDGLMSSYQAAKKILSKFNIKAIFFIPTQILELKNYEDMKKFALKNIYYGTHSSEKIRKEEYVMMGKNELLDLKRDGHMIAAHTHSHLKLININDQAAVDREIIKPKKILENLLQESVDAFAFPVGTERVVSSYAYPAIKKNYRYCFSGLAGINTQKTDHHLLFRDSIHAHYSLNHVQNLFDGTFDFYYLYKMFRLRKSLEG